MSKLYWNSEADTVETLEKIRSAYDLFSPEYESFDYFLSACMYWNNGALVPLNEKIDRLQRRLDRYGNSLDIEEIEEITQEINSYKKLFSET